MTVLVLVILSLLALVFYTHAGYPLLMALLSRLQPRALHHSEGEASGQGISVVICVRNASDLIGARLKNLIACDWGGPREIVVYCDGCTDDTGDVARGFVDHGVLVVENAEPRGKAAALNVAIPLCKYSIVVLCDARQTFAPAALKHLAMPFGDSSVMAVSGLLEIAASDAGGGQGVDLYWRIERKLREWEARYDSVIGCTGAICAIRRDAFRPLDEDTILDDVVIPMRLAVEGGRIYYEPRAIAYDPQMLDPEKEKRRKLRTLVGNYQMIERYPTWLLPTQNRLWWQLISHKYLRLAVPWILVAIALLSLAASSTWIGEALLLAQSVAYACAAVGLFLPQWRMRLFTIPAGFLLLQWSCAMSLIAYLRHRQDLRVLWTVR
ncbi:MAG: glycosyltransferase family 2 protein [Verrucomicrobiaceae bacterium]|nr:glycosyltransferase family 2 protein [Verrucomicrobiaceae bacterium]